MNIFSLPRVVEMIKLKEISKYTLKIKKTKSKKS